jgi:hypothetical protein
MAINRMMPYTARVMQPQEEGPPQHERHDAVACMPEYRLLEALLTDAINTYIYCDEANRAWIEARRWFTRAESPNFNLYLDGITFLFVCAHLGLDASYVRKRTFAARIRLKSVDTSREHTV